MESKLIKLFFVFGAGFCLSCDALDCSNLPNYSSSNPVLAEYSFSNIGSGQGMQLIRNSIYIYGDGNFGTVLELDMNLNSTGWIGYFTYNGKDLISHPNGIAYKDGYPTFVGATLGGVGIVYQVNWEKFKEDGNLDRALINTFWNSENRGYSRPEYVEYGGEWLLAVGEYEKDGVSEILLLDPEKLTTAKYLDDPEVVKYRFLVSPYVQMLHWSVSDSQLILVQNVDEFEGWRLTYLDLSYAIASGSGLESAVTKTKCLPYATELEGYRTLSDGRDLFLTAESYGPNLFVSVQ